MKRGESAARLRTFRSTAREVVALSKKAKLVPAIVENAGKKGNPAERRSWEVSLPALAKVLIKAGLGEVAMLIECSLPGSSQRVDALLAGVHPKTGADNYVLVELKQWSHAELGWGSDRLVWSLHTRGDQLHPVDQVRGYCRYLQRDVALLHDRPEALHGVAYLHNAEEKLVRPLFELPPDQFGRLYTGDQREGFIEFLRSQLTPTSGLSAAERLLDSEIRQRTTLLRSTPAELYAAGDSLVDNQRLAFEAVLNRVTLAYRSNQKCVVLVTGGPGSGKSIIAMSLLMRLHKDRRRVRYATGSEAITKTMRRVYGRQERGLEKLITYYKNLTTMQDQWLDVVICDEAHRIRRTSTDRFTRAIANTKRPQVDELIEIANVPVFLLDENQVVRPDEVGTVDLIRDHAARAGRTVFQINLDGQFRCGGSAAYDEWVLNLLGLRPLGPTPWKGDDNFTVRVANSPQQMEDFLRSQITDKVSARIMAGYCWEWTIDPDADGALVDDIKIGNWSKPWNSFQNKIGGAGDPPPKWLWANDPRGFEQVGCVYTAQGFEFDWAGIILGPEIVVEDQALVIRRDANKDRKLRSRTLFDEEFDILIRNTYKVLLTRGMRGVVLYAVDAATQEFLSSLVDRLEFVEPGVAD
ncbi:DNA/RNA helicase domain-containing protein [Nocardia sp. NPDC058518]|uniref:DNA/RNA helicase domain-containing protein n=1 Tax=Nocardia sp. NPDC058518 TaxID=3346534 RepID=UPI003664208C